jgi:hypothetical protein
MSRMSKPFVGKACRKVPFKVMATTGEQARITLSRNECEVVGSFARATSTTRNYECSAVHPDYVLAGKGANFTEVLFGVTATTGNYGCPAAHLNYVQSEMNTNFWNDHGSTRCE